MVICMVSRCLTALPDDAWKTFPVFRMPHRSSRSSPSSNSKRGVVRIRILPVGFLLVFSPDGTAEERGRPCDVSGSLQVGRLRRSCALFFPRDIVRVDKRCFPAHLRLPLRLTGSYFLVAVKSVSTDRSSMERLYHICSSLQHWQTLRFGTLSRALRYPNTISA